MSRSKWKGPLIYSKLYKKNYLEVKSRNAKITPNMVNESFKIHSGNGYSEVIVTEEMLSHSFGEFANTRKKFSFKKNKKTRKRGSKK